MSHSTGRGSSEAGRARLVVLSGCSGGGKSTLLAALAACGVATVPEPGRRIVRQGMAGDAAALPWRDPAAFARRAMAMALEDRARALAAGGLHVFDRGLVDACAALERATGEPALDTFAAEHPYASPVFMTPPWPELFVSDHERPHGFSAAVTEYDHLLTAFDRLGHEILVLPRVAVAERVDFVLKHLPR